MCVCARFAFFPDDHPSRLADRNQLLLRGGRAQLLREESGVGPGQAEGDGVFMSDLFGLRLGCVSNRSSAGTVAVHHPCVLCGRARHLASQEIAEEEFAGQQSAQSSATKGNHAAVLVLPQDVRPLFPTLTSPFVPAEGARPLSKCQI